MQVRHFKHRKAQIKYLNSLSSLFLILICAMVLAKLAINHDEKQQEVAKADIKKAILLDKK